MNMDYLNVKQEQCKELAAVDTSVDTSLVFVVEVLATFEQEQYLPLIKLIIAEDSKTSQISPLYAFTLFYIALQTNEFSASTSPSAGIPIALPMFLPARSFPATSDSTKR